MKVAIPADSKNPDSAVSLSFGRAPLFMIHDTETGSWESLENPAATAPGGAGVKAAQVLVDAGVSVVLAPRCGENAAEVLLAAGTDLYRTGKGSLAENLTAFEDGKLELLTDIHPGFHGH